MSITKEDVDIGMSHPGVIKAAKIAHVAWCEEMDRCCPGWGQGYLRHLSKCSPTGISMRIRVASVMAAIRRLEADPAQLIEPNGNPVVTPDEISKSLDDTLVFELMSLANDAWDDEIQRTCRVIEFTRIPFKDKFRPLKGSDPRRLYVASQLAVLKCIPGITTSRQQVLAGKNGD